MGRLPVVHTDTYIVDYTYLCAYFLLFDYYCSYFFSLFDGADANAAASRRHECPVSPYWILAGWHALGRRLSDRSREEQMEVFEKDTSLPSSLASAQTFPLRH